MVKLYILLFSILAGSAGKAQMPCRFQRAAGSNGFVYPRACVDSLLHLEKYTAVVYGEFHTRNFTPLLKYHLLLHLHDNYGYRHVFLETSHSFAWLLNQYLATGDTTLFDRDPLKWFNSAGGYGDLWRALSVYSRSLPAGQRFVIHGTDFERSEEMLVLQRLIPSGREIPESLQPVFREIRRYADDTTDVDFTPEGARRQAEIRKAFRAHAADVKMLYGDNMPVVERIISNTTKQRTNWRPRNKTINAFIRRAVKEDRIEKLVGFFGSAHTDYRSPSSIPKGVNRLPGFRGKTLNIVAQGYHLYSFMTKRVELTSGSRSQQERLHVLYDQWLGPVYRAALLPAALTGEKSLLKHADFVLLADDF